MDAVAAARHDAWQDFELSMLRKRRADGEPGPDGEAGKDGVSSGLPTAPFCRLRSNNTQTTGVGTGIPNAVWTKVELPVAEFDNGVIPMADTANSQIVISKDQAGIFTVQVGVQFENTSSGDRQYRVVYTCGVTGNNGYTAGDQVVIAATDRVNPGFTESERNICTQWHMLEDDRLHLEAYSTWLGGAGGFELGIQRTTDYSTILGAVRHGVNPP
jgi:hypothetical protein